MSLLIVSWSLLLYECDVYILTIRLSYWLSSAAATGIYICVGRAVEKLGRVK